jgi:hypothetical protein
MLAFKNAEEYTIYFNVRDDTVIVTLNKMPKSINILRLRVSDENMEYQVDKGDFSNVTEIGWDEYTNHIYGSLVKASDFQIKKVIDLIFQGWIDV